MTMFVLLGLVVLGLPAAAGGHGLPLAQRIAASFERPVRPADGAELRIRVVAERHKATIRVLDVPWAARVTIGLGISVATQGRRGQRHRAQPVANPSATLALVRSPPVLPSLWACLVWCWRVHWRRGLRGPAAIGQRVREHQRQP